MDALVSSASRREDLKKHVEDTIVNDRTAADAIDHMVGTGVERDEAVNVYKEARVWSEIMMSRGLNKCEVGNNGSIDSISVSFMWAVKEFLLAACDKAHSKSFIEIVPSTNEMWEMALRDARKILGVQTKPADDFDIVELCNLFRLTIVEHYLVKGVILPVLMAITKCDYLDIMCTYHGLHKFAFKIYRRKEASSIGPFDFDVMQVDAKHVHSFLQFTKTQFE